MPSPPNTIVHVPRRFVAEDWGGTETVILEISRQQQAAGAAPVILTSMALATRREERIGGVPVRRFPYCYPYFGLSDADRAALDRKGGNLLSLSFFAALLRLPDVRLFHAHALKRLGGEVRTAARLRRKPFVVSLHGGVFDVPAAELGGMMKPIEGRWEWGKPFGALFGSRRVLEDADAVICVGQSELDKARGELGHDRVVYLPNGVDTARFATGNGRRFRERHGIPPESFLILSLSRIDPQKNQRLLLEAFARFRSMEPAARLLLIGPETHPAYAAALRDRIAELGLGGSAQLLPGLRNEDPALVEAFHAADVFVLPSMHEPFGIVVLEAWSAGTPVIASRVGGLKALVRDGETGLFVDGTGDQAPEALAMLLQRVRSDEGLRRHLAESGRAEARAHYDWSRIARRLEEIYQGAEAHAARTRGARISPPIPSGVSPDKPNP
ncbi:MAG: glycosyltransferase family 4 protein [Verrucomicrobiales bacterium]|nr:glycosyltransferase family 4 protein [Verrucomicrobiales bacterium]